MEPVSASGYAACLCAQNRRNEPVPAAGHVCQITLARAVFTQRASQRRHGDFQVAFLDNPAWPRYRQQLFLGDEIARSFDERREDRKGAIADAYDFFAIQQQLLRGQELKGAEQITPFG